MVRRTMVIPGVFLAGFLVMSPCAQADSLDDVVKRALSTSPRIAALIKSREAIERELRQARGSYLPQVDVQFGVGEQRSDNSSTRSTTPRTSDSFNAQREAQLTVTQRLFDGGETDNAVERQKARTKSASFRVAEDAEFLGLDVANVYLEVLRQRELKALAVENIKRHSNVIGSLQARESQGGGNVGDVTQAQGRLSRAKVTLLQVENDLRDAEALYRRLIGEQVGALSEPAPPLQELPATVDEAIADAKTSSPTLRIAAADIDAAKNEYAGSKAAFLPKVNLEMVGHHNETFDNVSGQDKELQLMLRARWNLYRGGSDVAARDALASRLASTESQRENALRIVEENMRKAWNSMEINHDRVKVLSEAKRYNDETLSTYKQQFELMIRTLIDVLDAEGELFNTRSQLVNARIGYLAAQYRILATGGHLLGAMDVTPPVQAKPSVPAFGLNVSD